MHYRDKGPDVPFRYRDLFPLGARPRHCALFALSIAASTFARLGQAPILTCVRQVASLIDATPMAPNRLGDTFLIQRHLWVWTTRIGSTVPAWIDP